MLKMPFLRLPDPPTPKELRQNTPDIAPVPELLHRPFWSVMIPTYNRPALLRKTLESVLQQDPGPAEMQIQVLDNGSTVGDIEAVVREVGGTRVEYFRQPKNVGQENFTECIRRSRGRWVQILHDDDMVMPGYYEAYKQVIVADPELVMVFGQVIVIDELDRWQRVRGEFPPARQARIEDFAEQEAIESRLEYAATVVRRDAFERVGGFCKCFESVSDWDLWFRVGLTGPVAMVPRPYACYRIHSGSGTNTHMAEAWDIREFYLVVSANVARLGRGCPPAKVWRAALAQHAVSTAWALDARGSLAGRLNQARWAWMLAPNLQHAGFLFKSWLKHRLGRRLAARGDSSEKRSSLPPAQPAVTPACGGPECNPVTPPSGDFPSCASAL